jgi:L-alanine-DL-glutamate epimerase-like enolase superfamily enzyme
MSRPTDFIIRDARCWTTSIDYRTPMKFGGRVVADVTLLNVELDIETRSGRRAIGHGSMPLGNAWAWPSQTVDSATTLIAMRTLAERLVALSVEHPEPGHPLQVATQLIPTRMLVADTVVQDMSLPEAIPVLAQLVAASPLEAAIFDAHGRAVGANTFDLLSSDYIDQDLSAWLGDDFQGEYLDRYTLRRPQAKMPLYHLVGALDPLTDADLSTRLTDGIPETLGEWILAEGLTHLKIKLSGDSLEWDVQRVTSIERVAAEAQQQRGCDRWCYSLDFNERCADVNYVLEFLDQLGADSPAALERVQYIEQPTHRDLKANRHNRMHAAAQRKPVVIDESLVDLESLLLSQELGYSGVALKACKGHGEALLMGAAAQKYNLFLCVQDLTCPGSSFLHSASLAAHIPTVAAIEGNGRQYCPAGNALARRKYPGMFEITDGTVATGQLHEAGLGFAWCEPDAK